MQPRQQVVAVVAQAAGVDAPGDEVEHAVVQRHRGEVHGGGRAARVEHLAEVAGEAEAAHVGAGVHADAGHGRGRRRVERGGLLDGRHHVLLADDAVLERAGEHADAEALGEHELVARPAAPPL